MTAKPLNTSSPKARNLSARLMAVQALYQAVQNQQRLNKVTEEFLATRIGMEIEGERLIEPDGMLFKKILTIIDERSDDIDQLVNANITKENKDVGLLLRAILNCAVAELLMNPDADAPVIINDYLNVAHSFYDSGETRLVNAVLDAIAKAVR